MTRIPKFACEGHAGVRREGSAAAGGPGRRQPLRHQRGRRDRHHQVRLSPADLSPAGLVRGQRLDALAEHALEHPRGLGDLHPAVRAVSAGGSDRQRRAGHGRDAGHVAAAAGDSAAIPEGDAKSQADPRGLYRSAGRRTPERLGADVGLPQPDRADQRLRLHRQPPS